MGLTCRSHSSDTRRFRYRRSIRSRYKLRSDHFLPPASARYVASLLTILARNIGPRRRALTAGSPPRPKSPLGNSITAADPITRVPHPPLALVFVQEPCPQKKPVCTDQSAFRTQTAGNSVAERD